MVDEWNTWNRFRGLKIPCLGTARVSEIPQIPYSLFFHIIFTDSGQHVSNVMCHISCVTFHKSCVTCQVSYVTCQVSQSSSWTKGELVSGGCVIDGAYPV